MKKLVIVILAILIIISGFLTGSEKKGNDIFVKMRFYEGHRKGVKNIPSVVSAFFLKPLFVGNITFNLDNKKESEEIKRIFNLTAIRILNETKWGWRFDEKRKEFEIIILNSHKFTVEVSMLDRKKSFELKIVNNDNNRVLLKTILNLPESKSSVFGFEDSFGKPFFLSLNRAKGESVIRRESVKKIKSIKNPVLIKMIRPVYPETVLKKKIGGVVVVEAICDKFGRVSKARVVRGNSILANAALKAIYKWVYEPYIENGIPKPVKFYVVVKFQVDTNVRNKKIDSNKNIPDIWPAKGYLTSGFGWRIHPITKKRDFHKGQDIAARKGTTVIAPAAGTVIFAGFKKNYGNLIVIDHKNGYISKYGQLSVILVKKGEKIKKKQMIGKVGSSSVGTGPHLHWEVIYKGQPINPVKLVKY